MIVIPLSLVWRIISDLRHSLGLGKISGWLRDCALVLELHPVYNPLKNTALIIRVVGCTFRIGKWPEKGWLRLCKVRDWHAVIPQKKTIPMAIASAVSQQVGEHHYVQNHIEC